VARERVDMGAEELRGLKVLKSERLQIETEILVFWIADEVLVEGVLPRVWRSLRKRRQERAEREWDEERRRDREAAKAKVREKQERLIALERERVQRAAEVCIWVLILLLFYWVLMLFSYYFTGFKSYLGGGEAGGGGGADSEAGGFVQIIQNCTLPYSSLTYRHSTSTRPRPQQQQLWL
jgi:hypothetical protein